MVTPEDRRKRCGVGRVCQERPVSRIDHERTASPAVGDGGLLRYALEVRLDSRLDDEAPLGFGQAVLATGRRMMMIGQR